MLIRVFVYDDNKDRRESLKALIGLHDNLKFVGDAPDCSQAVQDIENTTPDVVLMDINMPNVDGIEGLKQIKTKYPEVKVLMQTAYDDSEKVFTSIRNGASGYILKNDKPNLILQAIEQVYEGGAVMNPGIAQKVLEFFAPVEKKSPLTPKENEVLALLADGLSYKMVADKLAISYSTVNTHARRIYEKLHISSLGEAIAWYYRNNQ